MTQATLAVTAAEARSDCAYTRPPRYFDDALEDAERLLKYHGRSRHRRRHRFAHGDPARKSGERVRLDRRRRRPSPRGAHPTCRATEAGDRRESAGVQHRRAPRRPRLLAVGPRVGPRDRSVLTRQRRHRRHCRRSPQRHRDGKRAGREVDDATPSDPSAEHRSCANDRSGWHARRSAAWGHRRRGGDRASTIRIVDSCD